jgi:hypothetical protein
VECKLRRVNFRRVSDPRRAFRPAFGVNGISDDWYRITMEVVVKSLGAPATVAQPMRESKLTLRDAWGLWIFIRRTAGVIRDFPDVHEQSPRMMHRLLFIINL